MNFPLVAAADGSARNNAVLPEVECSGGGASGGGPDMRQLESVLGPRKPFAPTPAVALIEEGLEPFALPTDEQRAAVAAVEARDDRKKVCLTCAVVCDSPAMFEAHMTGVWHEAVSAVVDARNGNGKVGRPQSGRSRGRGGSRGGRGKQRGR